MGARAVAFGSAVVTAAVGLLCMGCQQPDYAGAKPSAPVVDAPIVERPPEIKAAPKDGGLDWADNVAEGLELAQAGKKPLMIKFTADWCAPCRFMEEDAWIDSGVRAALKGVVLTRVHDTDPDAPKFGRQYRVTIFPTMVFVSGDGTMIGKVEGYRNAPEFVDKAKAVLAKRG